MAVINSNLLSLTAQQHQGRANSQLSSTLEHLSSGQRVNSAADDAAGQAIGNRMAAQIRGQNQVQRNINDGISMSQTAQGALDEINERLQRIRELTVQGLNGTYDGESGDRIQAEINLNLKEIDRLNEQTSYNDSSLLDGSAGTKTLQVGANDGETLSMDFSPPGFSTKALGLEKLTIQGEPNTVTPIDRLVGTANSIPLDDTDYTALIYNPPSGAPNLVDIPRPGSRDVVQLEDEGGRLMEQRTTATHDTDTRKNTVSITVEDATVNTTAGEYIYSRQYEDSDGNAMSTAASGIVKAGGDYWIQTNESGQPRYYQAEVTFDSDNSRLTARALSDTGVDESQIGGSPYEINYAPKIAKTSENYSLTLDGSDASNDPDLGLAYLGGNYYIEEKSDDGQYAYYDAHVSFTTGGADNSIVVNSERSSKLEVFDKPYVSNETSYVHLKPTNDNVTVNYVELDGNRHNDVMVSDSDGGYQFSVSGASNVEDAYKTAEVVRDQEGDLLQTTNGNGDVILYYPMTKNIYTDVAENSTTITLYESDAAQRFRTPANPLEAIDNAIQQVDAKRSELGALDNRLESAINNSLSMETNLSAARSRIMDADYAQESSKLMKQQVIQQASQSILAQANQMPQNVLSLLPS